MDFDLAIIGGGTAGFYAALTAGKAGIKSVLIEKNALGGTCLNIGCIPTKMLQKSALIALDIRNKNSFGFMGNEPIFNWQLFQENSQKNIKKFRNNMKLQLQSLNVTTIKAQAEVVDSNQIMLDNGTIIKAKKIIIATGATPNKIVNTLTIEEFWQLPRLPEKLTILGGGVVGCEFAGILNQLGVEITLIEKESQLLPTWDSELVKTFTKLLQESGVEVKVNTTSFPDGAVLNATGRVANHFNVPNSEDLITIGDASGEIQLATRAEDEGVDAVNQLFFNKAPAIIDHPQALFSVPEVATWGITEEDCCKFDIAYHVEKIPFAQNAKSIISGNSKGWVKNIFDTKNILLGQHIIGNFASELIQKNSEATIHPTFFEIMRRK